MSDLALPERRGAIIALEDACRFLAEARGVGEVMEVRDWAAAVVACAREAGLGLKVQNDGAEIKIRAERRMGEMLREMPMNGGASAGGKKGVSRGSIVEPRDTTPTLADLGITKQDSHRWQRMAGVAPDVFEAFVRSVRGGEEAEKKELTSAGVLRLAAPRREARAGFSMLAEITAIERWLTARRDAWPEGVRRHFAEAVMGAMRRMGEGFYDSGGGGEGEAGGCSGHDSGCGLPPPARCGGEA